MPLPILLSLVLLQAPVSCPDSVSCRAEAEAAAARGDYEAFHDLAWRAVQKGKPNDPVLMFLLARAQSLSGRPDDAIVMLGRLVDMHAPLDLSLPDFERARRRPAWAALMEKVSPSAAPPPATAAGAASSPAVTASATSSPSTPAPAAASVVAPAATTATAANASGGRSVGAASSAPAADPGETVDFDAPANLGAFALAHDAVSRRFVIGDAPSHRLLVVDEVSRHVVPYVSATSAGFFDDLTALALDARRGDLWVASVQSGEAKTTSILHKLQLVSGRGLMEVRAPESLEPVRVVDLVVAPDGSVYALDAAGLRVLRLRPGSRSLELAVRLQATNPTALAAADEHTLFVATDQGIVYVDLASRAVQAVKSVEDLGGFKSLAWHNGALYGVQRAAGASLAVRLALDAARTRAQPRAILAAAPTPMVGTLGDGAFYYLLLGTIHRLPLR